MGENRTRAENSFQYNENGEESADVYSSITFFHIVF